MSSKTITNQAFNWDSIDESQSYDIWRKTRLKAAERARNLAPVKVNSLANPPDSAVFELKKRCDETNFALYQCDKTDANPPVDQFAATFGLRIAEAHRSADGTGVVALEVSDRPGQRGYIPYSSKAMNWHTDGYYNPSVQRVSAFILHCVRPAGDGGVNQLFDPEILYIRLRDQSPDYVRALMHPATMMVPGNVEADGSLRPASVGPVFYRDPGTGRLQMRYTARTRSISWREDPATREAQACLRDCLANDDPLMMRVALQAGQGILNNNVLHNRASFQDGRDGQGGQDGAGRLMIRVRFHNRVKRNT